MDITKELHKQTIRVATILTGTYVASTILRGDEYNFLGLEVSYTKGSLTSMELKIEVSSDGTNYFQQVTETTSSGTVTCVLGERTWIASGNYEVSTYPIRAKYIKISVKGTGTATSSSCTIKGGLTWA